MDQISHIQEAVSRAGGPVAAARAVGAPNYQSVQQWIKTGNVPAEYAPALELASGVSRRLLCRNANRIWPELTPQQGEASHA